MRDNFEACLRETLLYEGGWSDHPADPGKATMKGVTIGTFARYRKRDVTKAELRAISDSDLRTIYRREYWDKVKGDDLPVGLDLVAFDGAVNSGPGRGAKWVQAALGVAQDGKIGALTIIAARGDIDVTLTINLACDARMAFLHGLPRWDTFGTGWKRRVDAVRKAALAMADDTPMASPKAVNTAGVPPQAPPVASAPVAVPVVAEKPQGLWAALWRALWGIIGGRG